MIEPGKITFNCGGAIDFTEYVRIELLEEPREGFTEINPSVFMQEIWLPHLSSIQHLNMMNIFDKIPHIADRNPNLPNRWRKIWYKLLASLASNVPRRQNNSFIIKKKEYSSRCTII